MEPGWDTWHQNMAPARVPHGGSRRHTSTDSKTHLKVNTIPASEN